MRTRDDILSELVELKQNPPQSFSGSMYKTNKKNALIGELVDLENEQNPERYKHKSQFNEFDIHITITKE